MNHDRREQYKLFRQIDDMIGLAGVDSFRRVLSDFRRSTGGSASRENWIGKVHIAFSNTPLSLWAVPISGHMTQTKKTIEARRNGRESFFPLTLLQQISTLHSHEINAPAPCFDPHINGSPCTSSITHSGSNPLFESCSSESLLLTDVPLPLIASFVPPDHPVRPHNFP
jgi:hypothetical protein